MKQVNKPVHDIKLVKDVFVHQPSGLKFPIRINEWEREPVTPGKALRPEIAINYQMRDFKSTGNKEITYTNRAKVSVVLLNGRSPSAIIKAPINKVLRKHPEGEVKLTTTGNSAEAYVDTYDDVNHSYGSYQIHVCGHGSYGLVFETSMFKSQRNQGYNFLGSLVKGFESQ